MCWGAGILLSSGVIRGVSTLSGDIAWRLPFALQWVWPVPLFLAAYFAPESPWNAVRRGKYELARKSLHRLLPASEDKENRVSTTVAYIDYVTKLEKAEGAESRFIDCFRGVNLRRTEIVRILLARSCAVELTLDQELCRLGRSDPVRQCNPRVLGSLPRSCRVLSRSSIRRQHRFVSLLHHWGCGLLVPDASLRSRDNLYGWSHIHVLLPDCHRWSRIL